MLREPYALLPMPVGGLVCERRRVERLSPRAAIFWIGVLSLGGWTAIIALAITALAIIALARALV
jgi:hypothetical protein